MRLQVYSVNASTRRIKQKLKHDASVPLNTDEFNTLLHEITEYVHGRQCTLPIPRPQRRLPSPDIDDYLDAAYEEMAERATAEQQSMEEESKRKRQRESSPTPASAPQTALQRAEAPAQQALLQPSQASAQHAAASDSKPQPFAAIAESKEEAPAPMADSHKEASAPFAESTEAPLAWAEASSACKSCLKAASAKG